MSKLKAELIKLFKAPKIERSLLAQIIIKQIYIGILCIIWIEITYRLLGIIQI